MQIELEDIIVNILLQLKKYKNLNFVSNIKVKEIINYLMDDYLILDNRNCMINSKYFNLNNIDNLNFEYVLKEHIEIKSLIIYNLSLPVDLVRFFNCDEVFDVLEIDEIKEYIFDENLSEFYFNVADSMNITEYIEFRNCVKNKKCSNCMKIDCNRRRSGLVCNSWDNVELVGKSKVLKYYGN